MSVFLLGIVSSLIAIVAVAVYMWKKNIKDRYSRITSNCLQRAEYIIDSLRSSNNLTPLLKKVVENTKEVEDFFIPYACSPDPGQETIWQSEFIFGPNYDLSSVPVTIDEKWPFIERDFMWSYRLFLYQTQRGLINALNNKPLQKQLLNNTNDIYSPVCYNPVYILHDPEDKLSSIEISFDTTALIKNLLTHIAGMKSARDKNNFNAHTRSVIEK